jgi:hypothetical protein
MQYKYISMIFGIVPSTVSSYINKMMQLICLKLKNNEAAKIIFPDEATKAIYANMIHQREPSVNNVIGFVDGLRLAARCGDTDEAQSVDYSGYSRDTACNNVFAFAPNGKIVYACINAPGSWHDSQVALPLIDKVIRDIGVYALCVDGGFPMKDDLYDKFVGPISRKRKRHLSPILREAVIARHEVYVSLRQASEWGMRGLQGSFCRLKDKLTSDKEKRFLLILSIVLLSNYRTEYVGLNQIANVFNHHYEQFINLEGYDRIRRYFL